MNIFFDLSGHLDVRVIPEYDSELDDVNSMLMHLCELMDASNKCKFYFGGFGQDKWPVDVRTDLAILLEQLPVSLNSIEKKKPFEIDFYEQGIERILNFEPLADSWKVTCRCYSNWIPLPDEEVIESEKLEEMFRTLYDKFLKSVDNILIADTTWSNTMKEWML